MVVRVVEMPRLHPPSRPTNTFPGYFCRKNAISSAPIQRTLRKVAVGRNGALMWLKASLKLRRTAGSLISGRLISIPLQRRPRIAATAAMPLVISCMRRAYQFVSVRDVGSEAACDSACDGITLRACRALNIVTETTAVSSALTLRLTMVCRALTMAAPATIGSRACSGIAPCPPAAAQLIVNNRRRTHKLGPASGRPRQAVGHSTGAAPGKHQAQDRPARHRRSLPSRPRLVPRRAGKQT